MNFAQPLWLLAGLACCIGLALWFHYMTIKRQAALENFVSHQLVGRLTRNISTNRRRNKNLLIIFAVFFCFVALARPQYGSQWVDVKRKGIDLLFALDTSKSMLAEDIKPNRLARAHLAILDFVHQLDGDRVGLLPFAGTSYLMCPLTLDYDAFENSLSAVTTDIIPQGGTNIANVIDKALEVLSNAANHKILIIVTDGENLQGDAVKAAESAAEKGLTIYTVGVGTSKGELIPLSGSSGQGFVKDKSGNFVTSKLDESTLTAIADKSGGLYTPLGASGEGLETIYQKKLSLIPKENLAERRHKIPLERFEWPLAVAAIILILEMLIGERKPTRPRSLKQAISRRIRRKSQVMALLLLLLIPLSTRSFASEGEDAYAQGNYLGASEYYSKMLEHSPDNPQLQYNYGTAAYKNNMYDNAIEAFSKALKSDDIELQKKAYYNRGNSYYQKGLEMRQTDPHATIGQWQQAVTSLQSVLELDALAPNARHNQEFVKKQLAQLEEELKQQQPQDKQENGQKDQNKDQDQQNKEQGKSTAKNQEQQSDQSDSQQQSEKAQAQDHPGQTGQNPDDKKNKSPDNDGTNTAEGKNDQPASAIDTAQQQKTPEEQAAQDAIRRQQGKMTKEEAERMLNVLKQEEGELNFVPSGHGTKETQQDRDW